jgi:VCBS repeat-containing protein
MSKSVVPAAAVVHAKQLEKKKLTKQNVEKQPAQDEQVVADRDPDEANAVQAKEAEHLEASMSDVTLSGDFTFAAALEDAAASSGQLVSETAEFAAQGDDDYGDDGDGMGGTLLLVGAVGLVALGIAVLADGGSSNEAPTFANASQDVTTAEDTAVAITATATDPDGDPLTYTVSGAANGTVSGSGGSFTYTPNTDFNGTDSFTITATDGDGETATQTVNVTVTAVNDAPKPDAENTSSLTIDEDTTGTIIIAYTDPEGDPVTATLTSGVANGTLTENEDGTYTYTPDANFNGTDSLSYTVSDGTASTDVTVDITVNPVNDAPEFPGESAALLVDQNTTAASLLTATDVDGDALTFSLLSAATNGTATVAEDGSLTYTPNADFLGDDTFTVQVDDGNGGTDTATINVSVLTTNNAPDFGADSADISVATGMTFNGTVVATDADDDDLSYTLGTAATNGTATVEADGSYTYTPNADFVGSDVYTVVVSDGRGGTDELTVNVTVTPDSVSIDRGLPSGTPDLVSADDDPTDDIDPAVTFSDDAAVDTNVTLINFTDNDVIHVTGATADDYSFTTGSGAGGADDLYITYANTAAGTTNIILIEDILGPGFVTDYASAVAAAGFEFMTFG